MEKGLAAIVSVLAVGSTLFFSPETNAQSPDTIQSKYVLYDTIQHKFNREQGGADEVILQLLAPALNYKKNLSLIKVFEYYDSSEKQTMFEPIKDGEGDKSKKLFIQTIEKNFKILERLENIPIEEVKEEEKNLKNLMLTLDKYHEQVPKNYVGSQLVKTLVLFNIIREAITDSTTDIPDTKDLIYMTNEKLGDCSEHSAAQYALLNYYDIETRLKFGKLVNKKEKPYLHVWINVKINDDIQFDLDSRNMQIAVPLEPRNPLEIKTETYEELHTHKK